MRGLQVVPGTTPKGKSMTRNHILVQKQFWVNKADLAPTVQIANDRDTNQTP